MRQMTRLLAPLSVLARGQDPIWDTLRAAQDEAETDRLLDDLAGGEKKLDARLKRAEAQIVRLKDQVRNLEADRENLSAQLQAVLKPEHEAAEPSEDLTEQDDAPGDFSALWERWEEDSNGALVFTPNAKRGWEKCPSAVPLSQTMRETLSVLAELAGEWRRRHGRVATSLVSWIGDQTPLKYAPADDGLRRKGLNKFKFEGKSWDRTPHIKLVDNTSPDRVGRIYFAIDNVGKRWIVDHVGLKLYGL
ncbi:hypothetical protein [Streptomyces triculaminicus]|uniref:hypothetical protein n=1 Tax=Streptomyces triculaminicus TaxID=2816232 RepID=UPI0037D1678D